MKFISRRLCVHTVTNLPLFGLKGLEFILKSFLLFLKFLHVLPVT